MICKNDPFVRVWETAARMKGVDLQTCTQEQFEEVVVELFYGLYLAWVSCFKKNTESLEMKGVEKNENE